MSEARTIARAAAVTAGGARAPLPYAELERMARLIYAAARRQWLSCAVREPSEPEDGKE
jgi:hypothetical protein